MSDLKEECFCRLQLLSTKGVTPVLVKVLEDIVRKTCNGDIDKFLNVFKKEILKLQRKKIVNKAAFQILFPQNGKTDINSWDISLLTCILLNFCTLEGRCDRQNLIKLLEQEAANNGTVIQAFLSTNKVILDQNIQNQISDIQYDQIYPKSGVPVDITTWDFEVIVLVLAVCSTGVRSQDLKDLLKPLVKLETDLGQFNTDLVAFLRKHATLLNDLKETGIVSNQQHELLYPTTGMYPDLNTWDPWLLVMVILNVCAHLKSCSIKSIQSLRCLRNENIAHASSPEIEESKFRTLWKKIVDEIEIVIENEIQGYNLEQWKVSISHIRSGPLNKQESVDILKEWYKEQNELNKRITENNETITKVNQTVEEMRLNQEQSHKKLEQQINQLALNQSQVLKKLNDNVQVISEKRPDGYKSRVEIQCVNISIFLQGNDIAVVRRAEDSIRQAFDEELDVTKKDTAAKLSLMEIKEITSIKKEITKEGSVIVGVIEGSIRLQIDQLAAAVGPIVGDVVKINTDDFELPLLVEDENQQLLEEPTDFKYRQTASQTSSMRHPQLFSTFGLDASSSESTVGSVSGQSRQGAQINVNVSPSQPQETSSVTPEIRTYKKRFNSDILCASLWGVNLLIGTDSGLLFLDRSGQGKVYSLVTRRKFSQMEVLEKQNILVTISGKKNKIRVYYLSWLFSKIFKTGGHTDTKVNVGEFKGCVHFKVVTYDNTEFLVIALKYSIEIYTWAPKPYHKFMAFKSFVDLSHQPLTVDLTVEEGQRLKVLYGSNIGFHAVDVDTASLYDLYIPQHVHSPITPHTIVILPDTSGMQLLLCYDNEGVYVDTNSKMTKNVVLQWGEIPTSVAYIRTGQVIGWGNKAIEIRAAETGHLDGVFMHKKDVKLKFLCGKNDKVFFTSIRSRSSCQIYFMNLSRPGSANL